jgi:hypothetical protein
MAATSGTSGHTSQCCYAAMKMARQPDTKLLASWRPTNHRSQRSHLQPGHLCSRKQLKRSNPSSADMRFRSLFRSPGKPLKDGFCHVVAYKSHVNLGFNRGALLPDRNRVLEGTGKLMRHMHLRSEKDLERAFIRRYLQAAIEQVGGRPGNTPKASVIANRRRSDQKE